MRWKTFGVIAFAALFAAASAFAASKKDWDDCHGDDPDRAIAACTRIINDRSESQKNRAVAYNSRGPRLGRKTRLRPRHRRLQRGDPPRPEIRRCLLQPRPRLAWQGRLRSRHRRLHHGHQARTNSRLHRHEGRYGQQAHARSNPGRLLLQPRPRLARQEGLRPRHRRLQRGDPARPEGSPFTTTTAATPGRPRATSTAPSPTTTRRSGSTRNTTSPITTAATPGAPRATWTVPLPTSTRPSGSIRNTTLPSTTVASRGSTRATWTAPSPTSTRRSGWIRRTPIIVTIAAGPGSRSATWTAPSPITPKRSG